MKWPLMWRSTHLKAMAVEKQACSELLHRATLLAHELEHLSRQYNMVVAELNQRKQQWAELVRAKKAGFRC